MTHPCHGCYYFTHDSPTRGEAGSSDNYRSCDYIGIVGRRRPCKWGKGCTVRKEKGGRNG